MDVVVVVNVCGYYDACVRCVGLLLRMFMNLYNFEVIDEDAFMQWKEELNDVHPGKGQALFQVR